MNDDRKAMHAAEIAPTSLVSKRHRDPRGRQWPDGIPIEYVISSYDPADDLGKDGDWTERGRGPSLMGLRPMLRELIGEARDETSIAVDSYPTSASWND